MDYSYLWTAAILIGVLLLIALVGNAAAPSSLNQRLATLQKKVAVMPVKVAEKKPVLEALSRPVPRIVKVEEKPVLKPLSLPVAAPAPAPVEAPAPAPVDTFDAYRQAMLSSGPRAALSEESRVQMQQKGRHGNSAQWREQTATLRSELQNESVASFLEGMNTSVNDRMVGIFESVRA